MGYLDKDGLAYLWGKIKAVLEGKQSKVSGAKGRYLGFTDTDTLGAVDLPNASTGRKGITYLVDSYERTDTDKAVTPKALNSVYKLVVDKQAKITASGILKGDGAGGVTAAVEGTDYIARATFVVTFTFVSGSISGKIYRSDKSTLQIWDAYTAGLQVVGVLEDTLIPLTYGRSSDSNGYLERFEWIEVSDGKLVHNQLYSAMGSGESPLWTLSTTAAGGSYAISAPIMGVDFTWDGGDNTCQVIDEGNGNWQMRFLSSGNLKFLSNRLTDVFLVGGGGSGATVDHNSWSALLGGGGGYTQTTKSVVLVAETVYPIVVGAGATAADKQAGTSSAFGASAAGGFSGGESNTSAGHGGSGGASGSGSYNSVSYYAGGTDGADGTGHTSSGQGTTTREFGESTGALYSTGGSSGSSSHGINAPSPNTGDGGGAIYSSTRLPGASGIVIIRNHREEAAA